MKKLVQRSMHCRCGRSKIVAHGLCGTCYTLKRQDEEHFGGLREAVLDRDGRRCRVCGAPGRRKRSIVVHHRVPGVSEMALMISLCPKHHAIVERTQVVFSAMSPLLLGLWREKHPHGHEQTMLNFSSTAVKLTPLHLFPEEAGCELIRAAAPRSGGVHHAGIP